MDQNNIGTTRAAYDSFAKGDYSRLPFDPEIEWMEGDVEGLWARGTHHGLGAVIEEVFEPTIDMISDFRLQCDEFLDAGDRVIVTGRFLGRGKETGNELNAPFACVDSPQRSGHVVPELHRHRELAPRDVPRPS